ncbi:MAG: electron transport complex subunit RsxG [Gammaproteobacteria bacterium]|nr:electron transport complex subunit RsxG [Gammaproteobacteria bacterium]MDH5629508.1 electron transport complex subunit RsxG [Gammaproteobacteria bacterium]
MSELKSEKKSADNGIIKISVKNGLILGLFAMVSTGLIGFTYLMTKDKIAEEIQAAMDRQFNEIIDKSTYDNEVYKDCLLAQNDLLSGQAVKIYRMRNQQKSYAIFTTIIAPDGYSGKIALAVGIYANGTIAGVRTVSHQETPGLGDKIEIAKSDWIKQFDEQSLLSEKEQWKVKKDGGQFDAMTGATITSRSVVKAVYNSLVFFENNQQMLFDSDSNCGETDAAN